MFTGLVQAVGQLQRWSGGVELLVSAESGLDPAALALGDSVAVDGVCLTVTQRSAHGFKADVSEETLARTTLAAKADRRGWVNLEPALRLADRLGGHLVSGHVDGQGTVVAVEQQPASWRLVLRWNNPAYGRYVCEKASVAVDGISLTVADCSADGAEFWIAVIPHTWSSTTLQQLRVGDAVNLEADLLAKYTERLLAWRAQPGEASGSGRSEGTITPGWLAEHGWS
jgi:riboflavin synthase